MAANPRSEVQLTAQDWVDARQRFPQAIQPGFNWGELLRAHQRCLYSGAATPPDPSNLGLQHRVFFNCKHTDSLISDSGEHIGFSVYYEWGQSIKIVDFEQVYLCQWNEWGLTVFFGEDAWKVVRLPPDLKHILGLVHCQIAHSRDACDKEHQYRWDEYCGDLQSDYI